EGAFSRVFFGLVPLPGGPPYRFRAVGGFAPGAENPGGVIAVPSAQAAPGGTSPLFPSNDTIAAGDVELTYDPSSRRLVVSELEEDIAGRGWGAAGSSRDVLVAAVAVAGARGCPGGAPCANAAAVLDVATG